MAKTGATLIMLIFLGTLGGRGGGPRTPPPLPSPRSPQEENFNMINISPVLGPFGQNVLKTGEVLIMLIILFEKVAKTGEVLIMLIVLMFWEPWVGRGGGSQNPPLGPHKKKN